MDNRVLQCWGKTGAAPGEFHPALFHMLDVGHVAQVLLADPASGRWRHALGRALGMDPETLPRWLPFLVALHDVGKLSAAFQGSVEEQKARLQAFGLTFGPVTKTPHPVVSQVFLSGRLPQLGGAPLPEVLTRVMADAAGGHHGRFAGPDAVRQARTMAAYEPREWEELRLGAARALAPLLLFEAPGAWPLPANIPAATVLLTGFTILCDWLGSDQNHFPICPGCGLESYQAISLDAARRAVRNAGFDRPVRSGVPTSFARLFADKPGPRPLQAAIDNIPAQLLAGPCLALIEAPTGEGKTEAALTLAHRLGQAQGTEELYYALPTTATSNQMFGRLQEHLTRRLDLPGAVKLVHGQAYLIEDDRPIAPLGDVSRGERRAAQEWFGPKKRALLAPFGVGTVDQVELAVLNVKHTALRLMGLAGKVVILDEVHAYDTYMTTIVESLLRWLRALGTSVIILSATLPQARRAALAKAYGIQIEPDSREATAYPSLWVFGSGEPFFAEPKAMQPDRRLAIGRLQLADDEADVTAKAEWLLWQVAGGGCACWMTNTVRRAQALFEAVDRKAGDDVDRILLHAQFPLIERQNREQAVSARYGPKGARPARGIVVGTQVLEQSLDLDFDVMVTDLAPIDLLLQRAGRLHRHERVRPEAHGVARLWINAPLNPEGELALGVDQWIYPPFLLKQTWTALAGSTEIVLPTDYRRLVEAVYVSQLPAGSPLIEDWEALKKQESDAIGEANLRLLPGPDTDTLFSALAARLQFEEDEENARWIVGKTRLGEESVSVIPLERRGDRATSIVGGLTVALDEEAPRVTQLALLKEQIRISHQGAVKALKAEAAAAPRLFTESALLKGTLPLWLTGRQTSLHTERGRVGLTLDELLGLQIK